jgi:hypothetical protein
MSLSAVHGRIGLAACAIVSLTFAAPAGAQSGARQVHVGVIAAGVSSSELDTTDLGVGVLFEYRPTTLVGAELEVNIHPADLGRDPGFSSGHVETFFGVTVGPRRGGWRPFAKVRPGILRFWQAQEPIPCIAVSPPPVRCTLSSGRTVVAVDLGGGVERLLTDRTFLRFDAGDRLLSFVGPVRDSAGMVQDDGFFAHDFRFAVGAGVRF